MASTSINLILFVILVRGALCTQQNSTTATVADAQLINQIAKARQVVRLFLNETKNALVPGLVISVSVKGEQKWIEGFGVANIENNVTMTGDAVMQIGSITKSFTVGLASRLMQKGKLDFDVPIRKYLSANDFPDKMWNGSVVNITLRQLFQMTAGVPDGLDEHPIGECFRCTSQKEHLVYMRDKELEFEPGSHFEYSNYGFELAGVVIESVLENETFDDAMREMFGNVLKLKKTAIVDTHIIRPHIASFYQTNDDGGLANSGMTGEIFLNNFHVSDGIITTMTDLLTYGQIWLDAYYGRSEHFLKQSSVQSAWTPTDVSPIFYGMGWMIKNITSDKRPSGNQVVYHSGATLGCRSILAIYPETEIILAASANLGECDVEMLDGIADLFAQNENVINS